MPEQFKNSIESEIAELTKQIEEKRRILEAESGIVEDKEIVRQAVGEKINEVNAAFSPKQKEIKTDETSSYLDGVDEKTSSVVNELLEKVFSQGISKAISEAEYREPYIIDAFHDALTDKMYEKLKEEGIVK